MRRGVRDAAAAPRADTGDAENDGEFGSDRGGEVEVEVGEVDPDVAPLVILPLLRILSDGESERIRRSPYARGRFEGDRMVVMLIIGVGDGDDVDDISVCICVLCIK